MKWLCWAIGLFFAVRIAMHAAGWPASSGGHAPEDQPVLNALYGGSQARSVAILTEDSVIVQMRIPPGLTLAIQSELDTGAAPVPGEEIAEIAGDITLTVHTWSDSLWPAPEDVRLYMEVGRAIVKVAPVSRQAQSAVAENPHF